MADIRGVSARTPCSCIVPPPDARDFLSQTNGPTLLRSCPMVAHHFFCFYWRYLKIRNPTTSREPMTGDVPSVPIRIGDVGYIHLGQFFLLFHAGSERGANVPQSFEPLTIGETTFRIPRGPDRFHTDSVKEIKATVGATISATPYAPSLRLPHPSKNVP